jgi:alginate O-acetyltransferase complex protein AlgI
MVFTSAIFLFLFLPLFTTLYFALGKRSRDYFLIFSSLIFYFWAEPKFIFVVFASLVIDWILGKRIFASSGSRKKFWRALSISLNVALLIYFKYMNFFVHNLNDLLLKSGWPAISWSSIALPLGLSFIVFEKITYSFDIYKGIGKPARTLGLYLLYALLFPKLIAGPIVKYHEIEKQLEGREIILSEILYGVFRFSVGLAKKVWVANTLSGVVDQTFHLPPSSLTASQAWIGILCFTFQIYFDFSGYTDMAIGLTRIAGFTIKENFNFPYISSSFTDFWRRWHISLSTWIKEYLYIPLGGNRRSTGRNYFNLWLCFVICGFWHGANWPFVFLSWDFLGFR